MKYKSLFESLDASVGSKLKVRRYSLPEMISESYKALYNCESNSNLYKLAEAHLSDVRRNPNDTERLSRQLSLIKEITKLQESGEIKDSDLLVPKKSYDDVKPKKERTLDLTESKDDEDVEEKDDENLLDEAATTYQWGDWQKERGNPHKVKFYSKDMDITNQMIGVVYEPTADQPYYGAEIYDNSTAEAVEERTDDSYHFDTEEEAMEWVEEWFKTNESSHDEDVEETEDEDLLEDTELTDEEVEELTKHLVEIRKSKKLSECDKNKAPVVETKGRPMKRRTECAKTSVKESRTWEHMSLQEFAKKSASKAFMKTFKKLESKLQEGTALTRQESIALYKAANSAMTQLSIELEHNPAFLETFKEAASMLSVDVDKVLLGLKENKAPSKSTMKSLSKFAEAILRENEEDEEELDSVEDDEIDVDDDFVGADEGDIASEEEEEFLQDYADARVDLHKKLVDEYEDTEDPAIQEKIAQDAEEVVNLPGITEEQVEEILGEPEETEEEETPEDEEVEEEPVEEDEEITDDELAELKRHLTEMRKAKKVNEATEATDIIGEVQKALKDAGISFKIEGAKKNRIIVARKDLERASEIHQSIDQDRVAFVGSRA